MNARPLTDGQISQALRAHLPERAAPGLRERVLGAADTTAQLRSFPSLLGGLTDADPVARRRSLLIAAALLVALAFASAAAVGALRLLQRDPINELSLEPPADVPAFVLSSYERLLELPPVAFTWHDSDSAKGRVYVDRSGAVRFDRFTSAEATEPSSYTILSGNRIRGVALVESETFWVEEGHEAIDDNPREYIRGVINGGYPGPGCELERDPSEGGNATAATGWRYIGLEYVAERPTHHVACVGALSLDHDLWLDIETRLLLRKREPLTDAAGQPIQGQFGTTEVTEIAFGEQPAELFQPPEGLMRMSAEAYGAYLCTRDDLPVEEVVGLGVRDCSTPTEAEATPLPTPTPMPTTRPSLGPRPSGPAGPFAWSEASLKADWPAPVRREPAGGAGVQPMPLTHMDRTGDTGSDIDPWVDIRAVMADTRIVHLKFVSNEPPAADPSQQWIAYGVVTDDDRDGVPDWRYGIDNVPADASWEEGDPVEGALFNRTRVWRTNLHTGQTDDQGFLSEGYRGVWPSGAGANFELGGTMDTTTGPVEWGIELDMPFYTWASVIVNGQIVATDYAPDAGWLKSTAGTKPGGTYLLEDPLPFHLSMTVPDGWTVNGPWVTRDEEIGVEFMMIDQPPRCFDASGNAIEAQIGPSVDDLVTFAAGQQMTKISENTVVTLDGYRGRYLEYTNTFRDDGRNCDGPVWPLIHESNQVWILDVDGVRLVIDAYSPAASSESVRAELRQIVESIHIER